MCNELKLGLYLRPAGLQAGWFRLQLLSAPAACVECEAVVFTSSLSLCAAAAVLSATSNDCLGAWLAPRGASRPNSLTVVTPLFGLYFSCDETGKGPPVQMHSLREFEQAAAQTGPPPPPRNSWTGLGWLVLAADLSLDLSPGR
eukprot:superscaffoldBa00001939_g12588